MSSGAESGGGTVVELRPAERPRHLTEFEAYFVPELVNNWLRFGEPLEVQTIDRRREVYRFAPGQIFGTIWWEASEFGTITWAVAVLEAVRPPAEAYALPSVMPGAQVHLYAAGRGKKKQLGPVERALAFLDELEGEGFDLGSIWPAYYRAAASRILLNKPPRKLTWAEYRRMQPDEA